MYTKLIITNDKVTYRLTSELLDEKYYAEAAGFIQKLFKIENEIVIPVKNSRSPANRRSFCPIIFGHINIARLDNRYSEIIIHETIHYLCKNKVLPKVLTLWAARTADITFLLLKLLREGKSSEEFHYFPFWYDQDFPRRKKLYFESGFRYYNFKKTDNNTRAYRPIVEAFNKMQARKFVFKEEYELGAFVAGIIKGILDDTGSIDRVSGFLQELIIRTPLEEAVCNVLVI